MKANESGLDHGQLLVAIARQLLPNFDGSIGLGSKLRKDLGFSPQGVRTFFEAVARETAVAIMSDEEMQSWIDNPGKEDWTIDEIVAIVQKKFVGIDPLLTFNCRGTD